MQGVVAKGWARGQLQLKGSSSRKISGGAQGSQPTLMQGGFKCTKLHPPELEDAAGGGARGA